MPGSVHWGCHQEGMPHSNKVAAGVPGFAFAPLIGQSKRGVLVNRSPEPCSGWTNLGQSLLGQSNAMYGLAELFLIP